MASKIDRLFGSKTRVAILVKLMMNLEKKYYLRELANELDVPYSMVYKERGNLVKLGVITEEKRGKVNLIEVNRDLPYFAELKALIVKTAGVGDILHDSLEKLRGVEYALVYGSFASGEETASSDIDLLVIGSVDEEEVLRTITECERRLGREVNYILWSKKDLLRRARSGHHLVADITAKPVIMVVGDEREFRRFAEGQDNPQDYPRSEAGREGAPQGEA
jgi:predicted nucleotidyltransferase